MVSDSTKNLALQQLLDLGFPEPIVQVALARTHYDVQAAADLLARNAVFDCDNEFDLLEDNNSHTVQPRAAHLHKRNTDSSSTTPAPQNEDAEAFQDSRIDSLREMGFSVDEIKATLKKYNNDINATLNALLPGRSPRAGDDEFDLLDDFEAPLVQPRTIVTAVATTTAVASAQEVDELDDSRIQSLREMGFSAADIQESLQRHNGDINECLNELLK